MTMRVLLFIFGAVSLSAVAQLVLKSGMSSNTVQNSLNSLPWLYTLYLLLSSWKIILGMVIYSASMGLWLIVLANVDVSQAYPFVGLGFLLTAAFGYLLLGESFGMQRVMGTILVSIGIYLIAKS